MRSLKEGAFFDLLCFFRSMLKPNHCYVLIYVQRSDSVRSRGHDCFTGMYQH